MDYAFSVLSLLFLANLTFNFVSRERDRAERERLHRLIKSESLGDYAMNTRENKSKASPNFMLDAMQKAFKRKTEDGDDGE